MAKTTVKLSKRKKKNVQDLTLLNLHALSKKLATLQRQARADRVRIAALERFGGGR